MNATETETNARRAAERAGCCDSCGAGGIHVDTSSGEIIRDERVWATLPAGARALMASTDSPSVLVCAACEADATDLRELLARLSIRHPHMAHRVCLWCWAAGDDMHGVGL